MDLGSPSRFSHILAGPGSPARVLDFGSSKNAITPRKAPGTFDGPPSTTRSEGLAPSPELKLGATNPTRTTRSRESKRTTLPASPTPRSRVEPLVVPRALPACSVMGSVHYPGFQVHQDPFEYVYPCPPPNSMSEVEEESEESKENLPLRPRAKKSSSTPEPSMLDITPKGLSKKAASLPPEWGTGEAISHLLSPKSRLLPQPIFPSGRGDLRRV